MSIFDSLGMPGLARRCNYVLTVGGDLTACRAGVGVIDPTAGSHESREQPLCHVQRCV